MKIFYPNTAPSGVMPNGKPYPSLRLDQLEAIHRLAREVTTGSMSALVGAGMGSGKTVVSVEVVRKVKPKRLLIVGVRDSYDQWAVQFKDQGTRAPLYRIDDSLPGKDNLKRLLDGDDGMFFIGLEMLRAKDWGKVSETTHIGAAIAAEFGIAESEVVERRKQLHTFKNMKLIDLLISDEAHRHSSQKSNSIKTLEDILAKAKIALSGTFFGNKFENAWSLCTWLWGKAIIGTKGKFEANYCVKVPIMSKDGMRQLTTKGGFPLSKIIGERNPGEYVETLPCYVFIATPIGPPPEPEIVKVDIGPEQDRQYDEMEKQSLTWIPSSASASHEPLISDMPVTQRNRLRTAALGGMTLVPGVDEDSSDSIRFDPGCESTTLNIAYDVLHRPSWVGKKVLILTHSKQFAIEVARRMGQKYPVFLKTGDTSQKQWEVEKALFMLPVSETGVQYMVAVISAVGTATDGLQANCSKVLWLSEDDSNVNNIQGANRVWRDGVDLEDYEAVKIVQRHTIAEGVLRKNRAHKATLLDSVAGIK